MAKIYCYSGNDGVDHDCAHCGGTATTSNGGTTCSNPGCPTNN